MEARTRWLGGATLALLAQVLASCSGLAPHRAPSFVVESTFTADSVASGITSIDVPNGTTIRYVDFLGAEEGGEARIAFRWKPVLPLPLIVSSPGPAADGGTWLVRIAVVYEQNHQYFFKVHRTMGGVVTIDTGGTPSTIEISERP